MTITTTRWDVQDHLTDQNRLVGYLEAAFEDGDPALIRAAIGDVAKARGISVLAEQSGLTRAGLYKALGENGNPSLETIMTILKALGVRLTVATQAA